MPGDPRDPRTHNVWQTSASSVRTWRTETSTSERFGTYPVQYQYCVVIDYNRPVASYSIYVHINGRGATAGCLSVAPTDEVRLLHWLNPALHPRIVMAPIWTIGSA